MNAQVTLQNGNKEVTVTITSSTLWSKEGQERNYFTLESTNKRVPIAKLYELISGSTRDEVIERSGRKFGVELGIDCDSKTKRAAALEAAMDLVKQVA